MSELVISRLNELAVVNVQLQASKRQLPILVDAERKRQGLDDLLAYADYIVTSSKFPQVAHKQILRTTVEFVISTFCIKLGFPISNSQSGHSGGILAMRVEKC